MIRSAWIALGVLGVGCVVPQAAKPQAAKPKAPPAPLKTPPIDYFKQKCARCHGPMGMFYAQDFTKKKTQAELRKVIVDMAKGPGGAPVDDITADALLSMHDAIDAKAPFLTWTDRQGLTLSGEAGSADQVTATVGGKPLDVKMEDVKWSVTLPKAADLATLKVIATSGDKQSILTPAKATTSVVVVKPAK